MRALLISSNAEGCLTSYKHHLTPSLSPTSWRRGRGNLGRILTLLTVFLFLGFKCLGADASANFDAANRLYEQGKFSEAIAGYQQLVQSGKVSPALYFNLGNACFKSGQLGRAIAAYRNAEKLAPRDGDVRANLQFVRARVQSPTVAPSSWDRWLATLTLNEWALLAAAVLWVWLLAAAAVQLKPALKQSLNTFLWCGGIAVLVLGGCTGAAWSSKSTKTAIVVVPDALLHSGPLDEAATGATVHDGAELEVLDAKNNWLQVSADNQHIGWIKNEQIVVASGL